MAFTFFQWSKSHLSRKFEIEKRELRVGMSVTPELDPNSDIIVLFLKYQQGYKFYQVIQQMTQHYLCLFFIGKVFR